MKLLKTLWIFFVSGVRQKDKWPGITEQYTEWIKSFEPQESVEADITRALYNALVQMTPTERMTIYYSLEVYAKNLSKLPDPAPLNWGQFDDPVRNPARIEAGNRLLEAVKIGIRNIIDEMLGPIPNEVKIQIYPDIMGEPEKKIRPKKSL